MKYGDYFIKDGKFIGDYEKIYKDFDDPWNQSKDWYVNYSPSRQAVVSFINKYKVKSIVEFGCGLGFTTDYITKNTQTKILGVDISQTSITKASMKFPELKFIQDDVSNIIEYKNYDCFYFAEITWFLLENKKIDKIFELMKKYLKGKFFIHNLVFTKVRKAMV